MDIAALQGVRSRPLSDTGVEYDLLRLSVRRESHGVSHRITSTMGLGVPGVGSDLAIFLTRGQTSSTQPRWPEPLPHHRTCFTAL
jgi:hypothetical protein